MIGLGTLVVKSKNKVSKSTIIFGWFKTTGLNNKYAEAITSPALAAFMPSIAFLIGVNVFTWFQIG